MGDYLATNDELAQIPDLKPVIDTHQKLVASGVHPDDAAAATRMLYAPVMSHGHMQRWAQVAWPIQQPPKPTPQQAVSGAAVSALVQKTGLPPQQAAAAMSQVMATRPYQPPPQRPAPTPVSELHHYGVLRQVNGPTPNPSEPSDDVLNSVGDFQRSKYPDGIPPELMGNRHQLKREIADWRDQQDASARGAVTGQDPGARDYQLPAEYYADSAQERHSNAASALTGAAPGPVLDSDTQDADARSAIGGY